MSSDASDESLGLAQLIDDYLDWVEEQSSAGMLRPLPPSPAPHLRLLGERIGGFEIVRRLGAGGMGLVYEARQLSVDGRTVALKVLRSVFVEEDLAERFRREVSAIASLEHEGIVPVLAADLDADPPFYAMPFIDGLSAAQLLAELRSEEGLPPRLGQVHALLGQNGRAANEAGRWEGSYEGWVAEVFVQLAQALEHAHERGVLHRDVKPSNIMITPTSKALLLDFGLASRLGDASLTETGAFLGTLAYSSPEQARGDEVDGRADVYSLGATLYHFLTLRRPFEGADRRDLSRLIEHDEPDSVPSQLSVGLRNICRCAMAKSPSHRYPSPGAMAEDLQAFLNGTHLRARAPGPVGWLRARIRKYPKLATAITVLVVLTLGLHSRHRLLASKAVEAGIGFLDSARELTGEVEELRTRIRAEEAKRRSGAAFELALANSLRSDFALRHQELTDHLDRSEQAMRASFDHIAGYSRGRRSLADLQHERMTLAFLDSLDVIDTKSFSRIEAELVRLDREGLYAAAVEKTGVASFACNVAAATVRIHHEGESTLETERFTLPHSFLDLVEGSYVATFEAEGYESSSLPFLVRREAAYIAGCEFPATERRVTLYPEGFVPQGWVQVPGGFSLAGEEPTPWLWVDSFLMREVEVTYRDWLEWLNNSTLVDEPRWRGLKRYLDEVGHQVNQPRFGYNREDFVFEFDAETRLWSWPDARENPECLDYAVGGLTIFEMRDYAASQLEVGEGIPPGWNVDLPSVAEWRRAARGADARSYPWGEEDPERLCANALSTNLLGDNGSRFPVGSFPSDCSPFGVLDMAGSQVESTNEPWGRIRGRWAHCGGSVTSVGREELTVTALEVREGIPAWNTGFRIVMRPLDSNFTKGAHPGTSFRDDFERQNSEQLGGFWWEGDGRITGLPSNPNQYERCSIREGRLLAVGNVLSESHPSIAAHPLPATTSAGFELDVVLQVRWSRPGTRVLGVELVDSLATLNPTTYSLGFFADGSPLLTYGANGELATSKPPTRVDLSGDVRLRLEREGGRLFASLRALGTSESFDFEMSIPRDAPPPTLLLFEGRNLDGGIVSVEEVEYRAL